MKKTFRLLTGTGAALALGLSLFSLPSSPAQADRGQCAKSTSSSDLHRLKSCNPTGTRVTFDASIVVPVPESGMLVEASLLGRTPQDSREFTILRDGDEVATGEDGRLLSATSPEIGEALTQRLAAENQAALQVSTKCATTAPYVTTGKWSDKNFRWFYNNTSAPTGGREAITRAAANLANGVSTTCGNRNSGLQTPFAGTTTKTAGITGGSCSVRDGQNTVGWGPLDGTTLGVTCSWTTSDGVRVEADIVHDTSNISWFTSAGTTCTGSKIDLEGVALHEFGHAVGLGHVASGETQVMKPSVSTCELAGRQLGRGDQNGLIALYGTV